MSENTFDSWAIIELFGHVKIAGQVSEQTIGGQGFVRVDVPEQDGYPAFTRFYGSGAVYSISPVSEEVARLAIEQIHPRPVSIYIPKLLAQPEHVYEEDYD